MKKTSLNKILFFVSLLTTMTFLGCSTPQTTVNDTSGVTQSVTDTQMTDVSSENITGGENLPDSSATESSSPNNKPEIEGVVTSFPTIPSDVPDPDIIRVGEDYYMVSTTMNLCPGVPIMKSTDLVHWQIVNYVYDTFEEDDITNLENGLDMYSRGSWAASLKYDEKNSLYYVGFCSNNHGFYIYTTDNIENGTWKKHHTTRAFHDPALFLENDKLYVLSASGGRCSLQELALKENGDISLVGASRQLFTSGNWGLWEGAHAYKVNDNYYVFVIASPTDRWIRTQLCYRTDDLLHGTWEENILYQGGIGRSSAGLAQGGIVDTVYGDWYAFAFQDRGGLGRAPSIVDVNWEDGWPLMGVRDYKGNLVTGDFLTKTTINLPESQTESLIVDSDEFDYAINDSLKLVWQWNHNPKKDYLSFTANPGFLRLTTDTTVENICYAHNSLTQRTMAPEFESEIKLNTDHMNPGDYSGLCAMADHYGMVGVLCDKNGSRYIYQANAEFKTTFEAPNEIVETPLAKGQDVYLKIKYDFNANSALFFYSLDGENWTSIGKKFSLGFSTATTFMGTRSWLFNYATKEAGGYVDFDYYHIN